MRKPPSVTLLVIALSAAATASAEPPKVAPAPSISPSKPGVVNLLAKAQIVNVRRANNEAYVSGPLSYLVEVKNLTNGAISTQLLEQSWSPEGHTPPEAILARDGVPVDLPANGTVTVEYKDRNGLYQGCGPAYHEWRLANNEAVPAHEKTAPDCAFTTTTDLAWAHFATPDRAEDAKRNRLYYENAKLVSIKCGEDLKIRADVKNASSQVAREVALNIKDSRNFAWPTNLSPDAVQAGQVVGVTATYPGFPGAVGPYTLTISGRGPELGQPGFVVNVSRTCHPKVTFPHNG